MYNLLSDAICLDSIGFDSRYYLLPDGRVYNLDSQRFLKASNQNQYSLKLPNQQKVRRSKKKLLDACFGIVFCHDEVEDLQGEQWKIFQLDDCVDRRYYVSSYGRVKSLCGYKSRILTPSVRDGYLRVAINGKNYPIHRLVATSFVPNPNNLETVDHINGIKTDNKSSNLQWLSREDNIRKAAHDRQSNSTTQRETMLTSTESK